MIVLSLFKEILKKMYKKIGNWDCSNLLCKRTINFKSLQISFNLGDTLIILYTSYGLEFVGKKKKNRLISRILFIFVFLEIILTQRVSMSTSVIIWVSKRFYFSRQNVW